MITHCPRDKRAKIATKIHTLASDRATSTLTPCEDIEYNFRLWNLLLICLMIESEY